MPPVAPRQTVRALRPAEIRRPRRIQSIEVGFRLIRALEESESRLSLKDVSSRAGMPPSKALLYLASFLELGMVSRDATGLYSLGPYAMQLGLGALRQVSVIDLAAEPMQALTAATRQSVYLSIWANRGPSIVLKLDSDMPVPVSIRVGHVLPLASSATGRVYLAHLPEPLTRPVLALDPASRSLSARALAALIRTVRRDGIAVSASAVNDGFAALSAPVFDHRGALCAALTVLGPASRMDTGTAGPLAMRLRRAAAGISRRLGMPADSITSIREQVA